MTNDFKNKVSKIKAREILDSRGFPTVEVEIVFGSETFVASVPSGTSKGKYEAVELRDGGERYQGMGVLSAVKNINEIIAPNFIGKELPDQKEIDDLLIKLDGTNDKSKLGANAILAVSMVCLRAKAGMEEKPLWKKISEIAKTQPKIPDPCILFMEGGLHGKGNLDIQEFMVLLQADSFKERLRISTEIYHKLGKLLEKKYGKISSAVGLEGAFTPQIDETEEALGLIQKAIKDSGFKNEVKFILDVAATSFHQQDQYFFEGEVLTREELLHYYSQLCRKYPIVGLEDPFSEEDWQAFKEITKELGREVSIIGDDLLVTNKERIKMAIKEKAANGLILKPNQIGTVTETIEAANLAMSAGFKIFVKHRSGETKDDFISDLACGLGTGFLMAGAPSRGERVAKYNRLLKIEEEIKNYA
ncbi:MAG: phosphopyruvate hydratase [Candidatus Portnoybacteria bacterium]